MNNIYNMYLLTLPWVASRENLSLRANLRPYINTGFDKQKFSAHNCKYFLTCNFEHIFWVLKRTVSVVLGAQKNRLNETVLLSTHNICFG